MLWEKVREHSIRARNYSVHRYVIPIYIYKFTKNHEAEEKDGEEDESEVESLRRFNDNLSNLKLETVLNCLAESASPAGCVVSCSQL